MATMSTKLLNFGTSRRDKEKKVKTLGAKANTVDTFVVQSPVIVSAAEGLCRKLVIHQNCIMQHIESITNSLEPNSETKPSSYGQVVTELLLQLDCAISITQQCLTKDIFEKNPNLKSMLKTHEKIMCANVALLVKWADFAGRDSTYSMNSEYIFLCVKDFKDALNNFVRLVYDNAGTSTSTSTSASSNLAVENHKVAKRNSLNDSMLHRVDTSSSDHPINGGAVNYSTPGVPVRSFSEKQKLNSSRGSLNSDSGDSDTTSSRRSGSTDRDRHEFIDGSDMSGSRYHGNSTTTYDHNVPRHPMNDHKQPVHTAPFSNITNGVVPSDTDTPPPLPIKKRRQQMMQQQQQQPLNSPSPHTSPTHHSATVGYNSTSTPPIPMRSPNHGRRSEYEVPPPIPKKKKDSIGPPSGSSMVHPVSDPPPLPIRIDSIEGLRDKIALAVVTPPPKPPRNDQVGMANTSNMQFNYSGDKLLELIDKYNKSIKTKQLREGEAPPVPIKKRPALIASQYLFKFSDYTFDDSSIPSLNIPDMTAPPPLPPKKKRRQVSADGQQRHQLANAQHDPSRKTTQVVNNVSSRAKKEGSVGSLDELELSSDELDPADEQVNFLEVDDVAPYLKFEPDDKGGFTLSGGPLDALIAYAASTSSSVKQYTEAFLSTYYTLISPDELIFKLLIRLQYFYKQGNAPVWQATTSLLVRVLKNMRTPLVKEAEITLIELLDTMLRDGQLKFSQLVRNGIVEKLNQKMPEFIPLSVNICSNSTSSRHTIIDFDADEVAKQLTILDADYFFRVDIPEMLFWAKDHNEEKCPQLTLFTTHFNSVSQWCQTRLLEKDLEWKKREKLMMFFINVMKALRSSKYNNFNSYLAILSAIESANVSRLDWSDKIIRSLEEPRALIDSRGSFKNYREAFSTTKPPCIPYIGLYLQDLTFLEEQPNKLDDKISINFGKRWKQFKSVDHIRFAQAKHYSLDVDPAIMGVFNGFKDQENNKVLYQRSLEIKPSNRHKAAT